MVCALHATCADREPAQRHRSYTACQKVKEKRNVQNGMLAQACLCWLMFEMISLADMKVSL